MLDPRNGSETHCAVLATWNIHSQKQRLKCGGIVANQAGLSAFFYLCYFLNLQIIRGIQWSIHLWLGSVFMAGIVGLLLSFLMVPLRGVSRKTL